MTVKEIREKSNTELLQEIETLKDELFNLRFQQATGQLTNTARLKTVKKTIARIKTVMTLPVFSSCQLHAEDRFCLLPYGMQPCFSFFPAASCTKQEKNTLLTDAKNQSAKIKTRDVPEREMERAYRGGRSQWYLLPDHGAP